MSVDSAHPRSQWTAGVGIEVDDLAERVHAGVSSTRTLRLHRMRGDLRQSAIDGVLDGAARRLRLPAAKIAAVVFDT
jgi:hypothetical protein